LTINRAIRENSAGSSGSYFIIFISPARPIQSPATSGSVHRKNLSTNGGRIISTATRMTVSDAAMIGMIGAGRGWRLAENWCHPATG